MYKIGFYFLLGILIFTAYANYDYWVFKFLIANNYACTDTLDEFYGKFISEENRRGFYRDFDRVVMSLVTTQLDNYSYIYSPQEKKEVREIEKEIAKSAETYALDENTVYLYIPNISRLTRKFVYENRDFIALYPNLVLDLRGNYGGRLSDFRRIANLFAPKGAVLGYQETRMFSRRVTSRNNAFFEFESITILQDELTASAAESLIMALNENVNNVTSIGQTTFGKGTGQVVIPLTGGYAVRATVLRVLGPQKEWIHLNGVEAGITPQKNVSH